jgi:RHS repeat-associated protein
VEGKQQTSTRSFLLLVADGLGRNSPSKERDNETGLDYFEARYYSSAQGRFTSIDPREIAFESNSDGFLPYLGNPQNWNRYAYVLNSPLVLIDQDGREPNKAQAGTAADVVAIIRKIEEDNPTLTQTEILQRVDGYFRTKPDEEGNVRYVYTKENGWLDMKHFCAAANVAANSSIGEVKTIVGGLLVEIGQTLEGDESAFSYEDLPTNAAGAEFGDEEFKPSGDKLSSQVGKFLEKTLQATLPQFAPNYAALPNKPHPAQGSRSNQSAQGRNDSASANNARNNRRGGTINLPRRRP